MTEPKLKSYRLSSECLAKLNELRFMYTPPGHSLLTESDVIRGLILGWWGLEHKQPDWAALARKSAAEQGMPPDALPATLAEPTPQPAEDEHQSLLDAKLKELGVD